MHGRGELNGLLHGLVNIVYDSMPSGFFNGSLGLDGKIVILPNKQVKGYTQIKKLADKPQK